MEVHLAIYDLSNGMARNLSVQFLGPNHALEMIPHTGLLCFGKEYFFGGGIQVVDPHLFRRTRGIQPCQIQSLGVTQISQLEFEAWCQSTGKCKFNMNSYDLLSRNCNNFSHEAALHGLKLPRGVPDWILDVPQRFLSSPMGQMIIPMLEEMQITQVAPVIQSQGSSDTRHYNVATLPLTSSSSVQRTPLSQPATTEPTATSTNPWANSSKSSSSNTSSKTSISHPTSSLPTVLDDFTQPMLSNDTTSLPLCIKKLSSRMTDCNDGLDLTKLDIVTKSLQRRITISSDDHQKETLCQAVPATVESLLHILTDDDDTKASADIPFALLLLRLIVLKYPEDTVDCMEWLFGATLFPDTWKTPTTRSLAWCVASNYLASIDHSMVPSDTPPLVDIAIGDWHSESVQVRQAASTFLYNYALLKNRKSSSDAADDAVVSMLCSAMENLTDEKDPTTRLRQLVLCGRLVFPDRIHVNEVAKELMQDLGFVGILQELTTTDPEQEEEAKTELHGDTITCNQLALELIGKFQD
jgi:hypothetical protein